MREVLPDKEIDITGVYLRLSIVCQSLQVLARRRKTTSHGDDPALSVSPKLNVPSEMPTEHTAMIHEKYDEYLKQRGQKEESAVQEQQLQEKSYPRPPDGISPRQLGLKRDAELSKTELTRQVRRFDILFCYCS